MNAKIWTMALVVSISTLLLAGCGERPVTVYKHGHYQGKADTQPWANEKFKGDKAAWENAVRTRTQAQNEYSREPEKAK